VRISDLHGHGRPVFSFEFFPPKSDEAAEALMRTVEDLKQAHRPDFVSVTYGAGGSTRGRTRQIVTRIQRALSITAMAHLTCAGHSRDEIAEILGRWIAAGIENVLALRGDPPKNQGSFVPTEGGFGHASELVEFLEDNYDLDVGAACYPEVHPEADGPERDLHFAQVKVANGARFLITQLFFENSDYFEFVERARQIGIDVPITPGIMPITNVAQIERFTTMCGAHIPDELLDRLRRYQDEPAVVMATGIEHAIKQCRGLLEGGAPGIHFYTLNKSHATRSILAALR
jgi:methylenetetrahydrofolate reductase (NADPH)